jgi:heme exporter protein A
MKPDVTVNTAGLRKDFSRRIIFDGISFSLTNGSSIAVTGKNGSGKSTLVKIIAGVLSPTKGTVDIGINGKNLKREHIHDHIGFVAPYLHLYDEFTAYENLHHVERIRGIRTEKEYIDKLLSRVSLFTRKNDIVRTYSSGMKQRLKYAFALLHRPSILILDEPRANLDREGIDTVYTIMEEHTKDNGILILATNDIEDLPHTVVALNLDAPLSADRGRVIKEGP